MIASLRTKIEFLAKLFAAIAALLQAILKLFETCDGAATACAAA
ncbi:MAG: hypothetical protein OXF61_04190 [Acidimicrobiaceae bacterium]|nr:hypothetical protein [Acidimicrobiaceae bacterium]MCY3948381.1 hypothetical protein [Acidimicrobiaceae bacterium]MDE0136747.1 hypothetical protein [Acidimicrobiaceae bacterium]MDE0321786.1 hypothetical protein [Acidimicrobiaceae bacterium]